MLVPLRYRPPVPFRLHDDLFTPLLDCHTRLRSFLGLALRLARLEAPREGLVAASAERLMRYFTVELDKHTEEEEVLLGSRLRALPLPEHVRAQLAQMEAHHRDIDARVGRLVGRWRELMAAPARLAEMAPALLEETDLLASAVDEHLRFEERVLFPVAGTLLSAHVQEELRWEMRARLGQAA